MTAYIIMAAEDGETPTELRRFRSYHAAEGYITANRRYEANYTACLYTVADDPVVYRIVEDDTAELPEPISEDYYIVEEYVTRDRHGQLVASHASRAEAELRLAARVREEERAGEPEDVTF